MSIFYFGAKETHEKSKNESKLSQNTQFEPFVATSRKRTSKSKTRKERRRRTKSKTKKKPVSRTRNKKKESKKNVENKESNLKSSELNSKNKEKNKEKEEDSKENERISKSKTIKKKQKSKKGRRKSVQGHQKELRQKQKTKARDVSMEEKGKKQSEKKGKNVPEYTIHPEIEKIVLGNPKFQYLNWSEAEKRQFWLDESPKGSTDFLRKKYLDYQEKNKKSDKEEK